MKSKKLYYCFAPLLLFALSHSAHAIKREDVLECGLPDGSKFVLRSEYNWNWIPLPAIHSSRVTNRGSWVSQYVDASGKKSLPKVTVHYSGIANPDALRGACAGFGMLNGVSLAGFTHLQKNGSWFSLADFQWGKLRLDFTDKLETRNPTLQSMMDSAGIKVGIWRFAHTLPVDGRLVFEQLLSRADRGYIHDFRIDAVYQSFSTDNGKTWSDPIITTDAKILEIGKPWSRQSFIARPISLNGKPIKAE